MSKSKIQITKIHCKHNSEAGKDEVYLVCQADAGIPIRYHLSPKDTVSMDDGDDWTITDPNLILPFEYEVLVTLWDQDLSFDPNLATYLQSHDFRPGSGSGSISLSNPNDAEYTIYYTYLS